MFILPLLLATSAAALSMRGEIVQLSDVPRAKTHALTNGKRLLATTEHMWIVESLLRPQGAVVAAGPGAWIVWGTEPGGKHALLEPRWKWTPSVLSATEVVVWSREDVSSPGCETRRVSRERLTLRCPSPLPEAEVMRIAAVPAVVSISARARAATRDVESTRVLSGSANPNVFAEARGTIFVTDTGLDTHHCMFYSPTGSWPTYVVPATGALAPLPPSSHPKIRGYLRPEGIGDFTYGTGAHGTATSGVAAGQCCSSWTDSLPRSTMCGVCPSCSLLFGDIAVGNTNLYLPSDLTRLFTVASAAGAIVHSASWGSASCDGVYDDVAFQFDDAAARFPNLTHVVAAGNCGPFGLISTPGTSKNAVSVGATLSRPEAFPGYSPLQRAAHPEYYNSTTAVDFTSVGPVRGGAYGPFVAAPGLAVAVAYALASAPNNHATGSVATGTSFSTPGVAGLVAAFAHEWGRGSVGGAPRSSPRSSVVRAYLAASATPTVRRVHATSSSVTLVAHNDASYGVPSLLYYEDAVFLSTSAYPKAWCVTAPFGGTAVAAWIDPPVYPHSDDVIVNNVDLYALTSTTSSADERRHNAEARVVLRPGRQRLVVRLDAVTGSQITDVAVVAPGAIVEECGSCLPFDEGAPCSTERGTGTTRCSWDGVSSCAVGTCLQGFAGPDCALGATDDPCAVQHGRGVLNGTCRVTSCQDGYFIDGGACSCVSFHVCGSDVVCATESCFASVAAPPTSVAKKSEGRRVGAFAPTLILALALLVGA